MREIRKYEVFKKSHKLALDVYRVTATFPQMEVYGLAAQTRRAAYSIPMNLAEGSAREGAKEFAQFVNIAIGSCEELRYQLFLAKDLSYIGAVSCQLSAVSRAWLDLKPETDKEGTESEDEGGDPEDPPRVRDTEQHQRDEGAQKHGDDDVWFLALPGRGKQPTSHSRSCVNY